MVTDEIVLRVFLIRAVSAALVVIVGVLIVVYVVRKRGTDGGVVDNSNGNGGNKGFYPNSYVN